MAIFMMTTYRHKFELLVENCRRVRSYSFSTLFSGSDMAFTALETVVQGVLLLAYRPTVVSELAVELAPWKLAFSLWQSNARVGVKRVSEVATSLLASDLRLFFSAKRKARRQRGGVRKCKVLVPPSAHVQAGLWSIAGWPCKNHTGNDYEARKHKEAIACATGTSGAGFKCRRIASIYMVCCGNLGSVFYKV